MTSRFDTQQAFCEALKVPKNTFSIDIHLAACELTTVTITYYPEDLDDVIPVLEKLVLVARETAAEPELALQRPDERVVEVTALSDTVRTYRADISGVVKRVERWFLR